MKLSTEDGGAMTPAIHLDSGGGGGGHPIQLLRRGGQWERGQDDLIKAIPFLLYLFRTCHLVTRALCTVPLADGHFGSLSKSTLTGLPASWAMPALPPPPTPVREESARSLGKGPLF